MNPPITSLEVTQAYDGLEGQLYELMMGELLHVGGLASSLELAERSGIGKDMRGIDLCCGNGASMRMLLQQVGVAILAGGSVSRSLYTLGRMAYDALRRRELAWIALASAGRGHRMISGSASMGRPVTTGTSLAFVATAAKESA